MIPAKIGSHTTPIKVAGKGSERTRLPPIKLNLLALTNNVKVKCELCNQWGSLQCAHCRVTYYCCEEHMELDRTLHEDICHRIEMLRQPIEFSPSQDTRERMKKQKRVLLEEMYEYTYRQGQTSMEAGQYDKAIPAAVVSAKYAREIWGTSAEVIPPLLVAAECYVNKGKLGTADGFLARVLCIELETTNLKPSIKARIKRNEGLIHQAKINYQDALECYAEEIYQNTEEFGPTHIRTSGGYCYLGHMFQLKANELTALSLYRQTVDIWINTVDPILDEMTSQPDVPVIGALKPQQEKQWMYECDKLEGLKILTKCYTHLKEMVTIEMPAMDIIRSIYAIGCIMYMNERYMEGKNRAQEGITWCNEKNLKAHPIHKKLLALNKYCERKIYKEDKSLLESQSMDNIRTEIRLDSRSGLNLAI
ncbi:zinc finger MYND domain-containing protein 12 [Biomphalaria pfeifferi]|uniref:Zinc finger MYND domain-containing protein 12 n=1 Tax=Biomphalaria pfeifferi TaxID=112525 RepID=A0AAD8BIX1_BIOPF|nr:zinc finger MYND domain-containing protein 12 [Biomphalaria pfeifferi]